MASTYSSVFGRGSQAAADPLRQSTPESPAFEPLPSTSQNNDTPYLRFMRTYLYNQNNKTEAPKVEARKSRKNLSTITSPEHRRNSSNTIDELAQIALAVGGRADTAQPRAASWSHEMYVVPGAESISSTKINHRPENQHDFLRPARKIKSYNQSWPDAIANGAHMSETAAPPLKTVAKLNGSGNSSLEAAALLLNFAVHATPLSSQAPADDSHHGPDKMLQRIGEQSREARTEIRHPPERFHGENRKPKSAHSHDSGVSGLIPQSDQTHPTSTPKEATRVEEDGEDGNLRDVDLTAPSTQDTYNVDHKGKRKGWPKGKPRGRKTASTVLSKPKRGTRSKTSRKSATKTVDETIAERPRRNSESVVFANLDSLNTSASSSRRARSLSPGFRHMQEKRKVNAGRKTQATAPVDILTCEACQTIRESTTGEVDNWISCNDCEKWFHSDCAGFDDDRRVRDVDKFFCDSCTTDVKQTTFVRKSKRAHTSVDYAGLNQGVLKTSDDTHEHHYIEPIKNGTYTFDPETFPRMRPELITADYFERSACFSQPVLIPAEWNPRQRGPNCSETPAEHSSESGLVQHSAAMEEDFEYDTVRDDGQDALGMVIPPDLTVRQVCNLVGPAYTFDVIDVKEQRSRPWTLGQFADYYEAEGAKEIRNVISLEVSETRLGPLLRRPKIVRQLDLQDDVWPAGEYFKSIGFYCLMSAADSYTDFHIDFGGSSVYYHIIRGSKTFFFIPPTAKHLKAYEDWNNNPRQDQIFLPHITGECYRVDLQAGDTMLIPSGWIHAVWTPTTSLVIGGNFLTRLHYQMQFRVVDVEKANKTPLKFRYPKFQRVMWYALLKYLRDDPLPDTVRDVFYSGEQFHRELPSWQTFETNSDEFGRGTDDYHARYYSQMELDGLPELVAFIFRTVMINHDRIEGISTETRKSVNSSIPKGHGDPLSLAKDFALWVAWKRGNENPPVWAHPDAALPDKTDIDAKKLSTKMLKHMQRHEAVKPARQSQRQQKQQEKLQEQEQEKEHELLKATPSQPLVRGVENMTNVSPKISKLGPKRFACDACRHRRIRCKHKEEGDPISGLPSTPSSQVSRQMPRPEIKIDSSAVLSRTAATGKSVAASPSNAPVVAKTRATRPSSSLFETPGSATSDSQIDFSTLDMNKRGRSKACVDCRKSKRRCIHDENGLVDPVKERQIPVPRNNMPLKRSRISGVDDANNKRIKAEAPEQTAFLQHYLDHDDSQHAGRENTSAQIDGEHLEDQSTEIIKEKTGRGTDESHASNAITSTAGVPRLADGVTSGTSFEQFAAEAKAYTELKEIPEATMQTSSPKDSAGEDKSDTTDPQMRTNRSSESVNDTTDEASTPPTSVDLAAEQLNAELKGSRPRMQHETIVEHGISEERRTPEVRRVRTSFSDAHTTNLNSDAATDREAVSTVTSVEAAHVVSMPSSPLSVHSAADNHRNLRSSLHTLKANEGLIEESASKPATVPSRVASSATPGNRKRKSMSLASGEQAMDYSPSKKSRQSRPTQREKSRSKTPAGTKEEEAVDEGELESLRLAREMAGTFFGLRARKSTGG